MKRCLDEVKSIEKAAEKAVKIGKLLDITITGQTWCYVKIIFEVKLMSVGC